MNLDRDLAVALWIARRATEMMGRMFRMNRGELKTEFKAGDGDTPVTIIDRTVGNFIVRELRHEFPDYNIFDEDAEQRVDIGSKWTLMSDPVDGTRNLLFGIEQSVVGLNLNYEGETVISIVGNPFEKTLTHATKGGGAFLTPLGGGSDQLIHVDTGADWKKKLVILDSNFAKKARLAKLKALALLSEHAMNLGSFGSNLYHWSLLAQGRAHYVLTDTVGGFWDIAGFLLVKEAGGRGTDLEGNDPALECQVAFGSTGEGHDEILMQLAQFYEGYKGFR